MSQETYVIPRPLDRVVDDIEALDELKEGASSPEDKAYLQAEQDKLLGERALSADLTAGRVAKLGEQLAKEEKEAHEDWRLPKE